MKESVKITVIAAGFREVSGRKSHTRPSYLPKTWKSGRDQSTPSMPVSDVPPNIVQQVARNVSEVSHDVPADDLDVPTFLRRQARST